MREGFFVRHRTATAAHLTRPKKFSFIRALLWFLLFGVRIVVYLIYYAAKQGEGRYVEVHEYGRSKLRGRYATFSSSRQQNLSCVCVKIS